jgi:ABC-type antimicrobial peptide transport system permease subunit
VIVISAEIVGVVGDAKTSDLTAPADPVLYMAFDQLPVGRVTFIVRSTASPAQVLSAARGALAETDPTIPMYDARPFVAAIRQSVERPRLYSSVVSVFALVALALAVIGIYGVLAYSVRARRRELGIRMALGARDGQVVGLVVRQGLRLAGVGLSVGLLVAWFASRVLATLLYGISLSDPLSYGIVCCALLAAATLASWLPARGAAAIDPVIAMRGE